MFNLIKAVIFCIRYPVFYINYHQLVMQQRAQFLYPDISTDPYANSPDDEQVNRNIVSS